MAVDPDTGEILVSGLTATQYGDASPVGPLLDLGRPEFVRIA